jgi:hypothetical protein
MKHFLVRLVFEVTVNDMHQHFDEQLRLFYGETSQEARGVAQATGENEEQQFVNMSGDVISWTFSGISEIIVLTGLGQGALLHSESNFSADPDSYSRYIAAKSFAVTDKNPTFA